MMPDKRIHRGPAPEDDILFGIAALENLRHAVEDYSLLLTKGYAEKSALKLVGDRFELTQRQRIAVMRCSCSDSRLELRKEKQIKLSAIKRNSLAIDGYNILITIEAALSAALLFRGRDGCLRDLASLHGTYRKVTETIPALEMIIELVSKAKPDEVTILLDKPVSNSGKLKKLIEDLTKQTGTYWNVRLFSNPDKELILGSSIVASSDSAVLDGCSGWINLPNEIISAKIPSAKIIDLSTV
ncbi:MAG: DUF434 domain-containing protein [Sedimentisphaerales bacterium]|nr:DUF434 domain-containing protein [Sedimentisphaerales bacterium]